MEEDVIQGKWLATRYYRCTKSLLHDLLVLISNTDWMDGASAYNSDYQAWMWKRGQGMDMVALSRNGN